MNKSVLFLGTVALLSLNACDHYSDKMAALDKAEPQTVAYSQTSDISQIEPAAGMSMGGATNAVVSDLPFSGHLRNNYIEQARYEESVSDYKAAKSYTEKAYTLSSGQLVSPSTIPSDVSASKRDALEAARADLILALTTKNIPQNRAELASAQVSFDCWVDQASEAKKQSACKQSYTQAMASLIDPNVTEIRYSISFEENKTSLTNADREVIGNILREYVGKEDLIQAVQLIGGNDSLSEHRLSSLRSILQYNGVASEKIHQAMRVNTSVGLEPIEIIIQERVLEPAEAQNASANTSVAPY
ncbi:MAG: hypothetical protein CMH31_05730 [Micavibrio sp.]|nr:hypothetical protein [Micavibrio sp.]|tara:strand:- start:1158 stop:2063 length:906 start_codon:yes stop_codon:yes gene_type:complete